MTLDEASAALMAQLADSGLPPLHELAPEQARGFGVQLREQIGPGPDMHEVFDASVGEATVRVLIPVPEPRAAILYIHGGGWMLGSIAETDTLGRRLAQRTGAAVVLLDYRLAPEHPYPAAVDDAWAALGWTAANLARIAGGAGGVVPLIVAGDSAGGNLAAIVTRRARDAGGPAVAAQVLVYPITDHDTETTSYRDPDNQLLLSRDTMVWFWDSYAPDRAGRGDPDLSPLRAPDLSGLAPAIVLTAEHDPLRDEGEAYARALGDAGVTVSHRRFDGQLHGFFTMVNILPGSAQGLDYVVSSLEAHLGSG